MNRKPVVLNSAWNAAINRFIQEQNLSRGTELTYYAAFKALCRNTPEKALEELSKDDMVKAFSRVGGEVKLGTVNLYKAKVKRFYKWLLGKDDSYPENVKWIKAKRIRRADAIAKSLLTEEEVTKMLKAADHPRDKALISTLYETGGRRGEVVNLRVRDVQPQPYGYNVTFTVGKTGAHPAPPITGSPAKFLRNWLEVHPNRQNPDAPLWIQTKGDRHSQVNKATLNHIVTRTARRAGIKRRVHPHMFRHTRATKEAKQLNEPTMRILHGWAPTSNTPSVYIHLNGDDAIKQSLIAKGIIPKEQPKEETQELLMCGYCGEENAFDARFCHYCGVPLKDEGKKFVEERRKKTVALESLLDRIEKLEQKLAEK